MRKLIKFFFFFLWRLWLYERDSAYVFMVVGMLAVYISSLRYHLYPTEENLRTFWGILIANALYVVIRATIDEFASRTTKQDEKEQEEEARKKREEFVAAERRRRYEDYKKGNR